MTITQPNNFAISDDPEIINSLFPADDRARELLNQTFHDVNRKKKKVEVKLYEYIEQYPDIPQFKNRLSTYYELTGKKEKAKEIKLLTRQQHPDYLFGNLCIALDYYYESRFDEMATLLGEKLELNALYPERKIFHLSEVMSYYKVAALYLNAVDRSDEAWEIIEKMENVYPGYPDIELTTKEIFNYNIKNISRRWEANEKTNKKITVSFSQSVKTDDGSPQFENKIIEELYQYDFRLPTGILKEILSLPEESLKQDLKKVLEDSLARYKYFEKVDNNHHTNFLLHAIFILAEKGRADCLPDIFKVFKNGEDFTEFYFGDSKTELLWIAFYKLAADDVSPLFSFLKEANIDTFSKTPANQALEQLFYHHKNLRKNIIDGYRDLSAFFIANRHDDTITDTNIIAGIACSMRDIAADEFKDRIKELYENNLVYLGYSGKFDALMKHQIKEEGRKKTIPGIFAMYEQVITTWAGYQENEEDDAGIPDYYEEQKPILRTAPKIGRNDPCPCGSGKKYKKCCIG